MGATHSVANIRVTEIAVSGHPHRHQALHIYRLNNQPHGCLLAALTLDTNTSAKSTKSSRFGAYVKLSL